MKGNKLDQQFNCKDCRRYSLCHYYHRRKKESEICHYFHLFPDNPTNGDVIKAVFPNIEFTDMAFTIHAVANVTSNGVKGGISYDFWKDWWNAPYKREVEE